VLWGHPIGADTERLISGFEGVGICQCAIILRYERANIGEAWLGGCGREATFDEGPARDVPIVSNLYQMGDAS
jgi:hypothetical protein